MRRCPCRIRIVVNSYPASASSRTEISGCTSGDSHRSSREDSAHPTVCGAVPCSDEWAGRKGSVPRRLGYELSLHSQPRPAVAGPHNLQLNMMSHRLPRGTTKRGESVGLRGREDTARNPGFLSARAATLQEPGPTPQSHPGYRQAGRARGLHAQTREGVWESSERSAVFIGQDCAEPADL